MSLPCPLPQWIQEGDPFLMQVGRKWNHCQSAHNICWNFITSLDKLFLIQGLMKTKKTASLVAQGCRIHLPMQAMQETQVWFSGSGRSLGGGNGNLHSSILAWEVPWTGEPGGLQSMGSQKVRHNRVTELNWTYYHYYYYFGLACIHHCQRVTI